MGGLLAYFTPFAFPFALVSLPALVVDWVDNFVFEYLRAQAYGVGSKDGGVLIFFCLLLLFLYEESEDWLIALGRHL